MSVILNTWNCGGTKQGGFIFDELVLEIRSRHVKPYSGFVFFLFFFQDVESYLSQLR